MKAGSTWKPSTSRPHSSLVEKLAGPRIETVGQPRVDRPLLRSPQVGEGGPAVGRDSAAGTAGRLPRCAAPQVVEHAYVRAVAAPQRSQELGRARKAPLGGLASCQQIPLCHHRRIPEGDVCADRRIALHHRTADRWRGLAGGVAPVRRTGPRAAGHRRGCQRGAAGERLTARDGGRHPG